MQAQTLQTMLSFAEWSGKFTESDRAAMVGGLETIRSAMVQPVGATSAAKSHGASNVTGAEFDAAVMRVVAAAMVMWLSGALGKVEVVA